MKVDVLGVQIDAEPKHVLLEKVADGLKIGQPLFLVTPYSESLVAAQKDLEFKKVLNSADFSLPDGIGVLWAAHYLKAKTKNPKTKIWTLVQTLLSILFSPKSIRDPIPEKISGSEFVWDLAELAAKNNYSIFLLGGFGDTAEKAANSLKTKFPNLRIAGTYSPSKNDVIASEAKPVRPGSPGGQSRGDEIAAAGTTGLAMTDLIEQARPDFLLVALGPIRQEKWIAKNLPNLPIKLAIGLGGTFDYLAGKRRYRAHFWAQRGLEWLWRLFTQPWRAGRIFKGIFGLIWYTAKSKY